MAPTDVPEHLRRVILLNERHGQDSLEQLFNQAQRNEELLPNEWDQLVEAGLATREDMRGHSDAADYGHPNYRHTLVE